MRSAAEVIAVVPERSADPLEHVDYRLAETGEEKDESIVCATAPICAKAPSLPSESERVTDRLRRRAEYLDFRRLSSTANSTVRFASASLTSEMAGLPVVECSAIFCIPNSTGARSSSIPLASSPIPKGEDVSRTSLCYACGSARSRAAISMPISALPAVRPEHQAFYRQVFLQQPLGEPRLFPGLIKPVGLMAADYPAIREKVFQRFPFLRSSAFERRMLFERSASSLVADIVELPSHAHRSSRTPEPADQRSSPDRLRRPLKDSGLS